VQACVHALDADAAVGHALNIGSGVAYTVLDVAARIARVLQRAYIEAQVTGKYRAGDIRHCYADITQARRLLGYQPRVVFDDGLVELAAWLDGQVAIDRVDQASHELTARGLTV
jgi:dTDP-L-rhamnose 4-epimerase